MTNITPIITGILALLSTILTIVVIPYIRRKTTTEQQEQIAAVIKTAVYAAEQLFRGSGRGQEKKDYVVNYLHSLGIEVDIEDITDNLNVLIEATVKEMNGGK